MATKPKGALGTNPPFTVSNTLEGQRQQRSKLDSLYKSGKIDPKTYQAQRQQVTNAILTSKKNQPAAGPTPEQQIQTGYQNATEGYNKALNTTLGQIQNQKPFNGDFSQLQQQGYNTAMDSFNRSMQPTFDKQEADFQQMAAERGWDPTSKAFADAHKMNVTDVQNNAKQQAMDSAFTSGLQAENQGWQQAVGNQMMPYNQLQYLDPAYRYETGFQMQNAQNQFLGGQNTLDRQNRVDLQGMQDNTSLATANIAAKASGKGALTYDQRLGLQNNEAMNNYLLGIGGYNPNQYSKGNGFANGLLAGATAFTGSVLK